MNRLTSRWLMFVIAVVGMAALAFGSVVRAAPSAQSDVVVEMQDFKFAPQTITISAGTTVVWRDTGQRPHTAEADDGSFNTGNVDAGGEARTTFNTPGTFAYFCKYHGGPGGAGMSGTIVVQDAAAQQSPAPSASAAPSAPSGPTPSVQASDQPIVGGGVTVAKVVAAQDGWIVIHTNTADNKPGPVIGQSPVKTGDNTNVKVALSQTPNPGDKLWPMLHIDAGAIGTYEFPGPDAPVIVNGDIVMMQIAVTAAGSANPPAAPPASLPNTGQADWTTVLLTLALVALGGGIALRLRRSATR